MVGRVPLMPARGAKTPVCMGEHMVPWYVLLTPEESRGRGRLLGALWPGSLDNMVSSRARQRPCLKTKRSRGLQLTFISGLPGRVEQYL